MVELIAQPRSKEELARHLKSLLAEEPEAALALDHASEIIAFGSVARGLDGPHSDFDVLAIGTGERLKNEKIDLIFTPASRTCERWWLGSDLAGHVATYGVWLKGSGAWKDHVTISPWSRRKKMSRALRRLSETYIRRSILGRKFIARYLEEVLLELMRLRRLTDGLFIGATVELRAAAVNDDFEIIDDIPRIFGLAPLVMMQEILARHIPDVSVRHAVRSLYLHTWEATLRSDREWRTAGRPQTRG